MNRDLIGNRLAQLREELAAPGEPKWSQVRLATELGLTQNVIARLEKSAAGSTESLLTMLLFYHKRGFNISWIVLEENSNISKRHLEGATASLDRQSVLEKIAGFRQAVDQDIERLIEAVGR